MELKVELRRVYDEHLFVYGAAKIADARTTASVSQAVLVERLVVEVTTGSA